MIRLGRVVYEQETFCCNWSRVVRPVVVTEHCRGKKSALTLIQGNTISASAPYATHATVSSLWT